MSEQDTRKIGWSADVAHMMDGLVGKTKKQLRAEAVERLRETHLDTGGAVKQLAKAIGSPWEPPRVSWCLGALKAKLIDLLTDDEQEASRHSKAGGSHSKDAQVFSDVVSDETTGNAESYNLGGASGGETIGNDESYDLDTREHMDNGVSVQMCPNDSREQLEADIYETCWGNNMARYQAQLAYCKQHGIEVNGSFVLANYEGHVLSTVILHMLDRQAAITERECMERATSERVGWDCAECAEGLRKRVDELTAERDKWRARAEQVRESYLDAKDSRDNLQAELKQERIEWESERDYADQCEKRLNELKAERDQLLRDLTAEHALVRQFEDDNERLREAIDAMENGQFYAMYREACQERDELKCEHEQERQQMQRVIDTQRESFRKMEFELAQAKGGSDDEG